MISRSVPQTPSASVRTRTEPCDSGGSAMSSSFAEFGTPGSSVIARTEKPLLRPEIDCRSNASPLTLTFHDPKSSVRGNAAARLGIGDEVNLCRLWCDNLACHRIPDYRPRRTLSRRQQTSLGERHGTQGSGHQG